MRSRENRGVAPASPLPAALPAGHFQVLCRVDAYADYVAIVHAESAEEAAELADWQPGSFTWEPQGTCEFDARYYVTLDEVGAEIESTMVGDR